jgi:thiol-disulfide isomerase/thioredoxin
MRIHIFLLSSLLWQGLMSSGQSVISGKWIDRPSGVSSITWFESVAAGQFNIYVNARQATLDAHDEFRIIGAQPTPEYIVLQLPGYFLKLPALDGDSLHIALYGHKDSRASGVDSIVFSGANAKAYNTYYKVMKTVSNQDSLLSAVFSVRQSSIDAFVQYVFGFIDSLAAPLDSTASITGRPDFYSNLEKDLKATYLFNVFNLYGLLTSQATLSFGRLARYATAIFNNSPLFSEKEFDAFRSAVYLQFDPLDSALIHSNLGIYYSYFYSKDLFDGLLTGHANFDTAFKLLDSEERPLGYLHGPMLELLWYQSIHVSAVTRNEPASSIRKSFNLFRHYFPHSGYTPFLLSWLKDVDNDAGSEDSVIILHSGNTTLKQIFSQQGFHNRYILVDLWATWCHPCIQEFSHKNYVDSLAEKRSIDILYLSLDSDKEKWEKYIHQYPLTGYHMLVSKALMTDILSQVYHSSGYAIPRYLFVDRKGNLIDTNMPRPSFRQIFTKRILELTTQ